MTSFQAHSSASAIPLNKAAHNHSTRHQFRIVPHTASSVPDRRTAPATWGELVQGVVDGHDFLVNCPIDRFASATVSSHPQPGISVGRPEAYGKVRAALELLVPEADKNSGAFGLEAELGGNLPRGKGMASSSAELAAVISAVSIATGSCRDY